MSPARHLNLLGQGIVGWALFWVLGLPDYYQQYSVPVLGAGTAILTALTGLCAVWVLARSSPERRVERAFWISVYFSVPFAALDTWYCGVYLGHGAGYLTRYWYLSVFYLLPWLLFVPTARMMNAARR